MLNKFIQIVNEPSAELTEILKKNVIGTPGESMLYQHLGVEDKLYKISDPYFINLIKGGKIIGTCCFCKRITANAGIDFHSFYIRYFSFKSTFRRKNIDRERPFRDGSIREAVKSILSGNHLPTKTLKEFFHYAYVDPRNVRSAKLCSEFGFETVRQYTSLSFSRISPNKENVKSIETITPPEEKHVNALLKDFYKGYTMFSVENLFNGRKYHVIRNEANEVVAGVQANPDAWRIFSLPGLAAKITLNAFSLVPYLRRIANKHYRFIALDGIYFKRGFEKHLEFLLEGLLAYYNVNSAVMVVDYNSELYHVLASLDLGLTNKLSGKNIGNVICKFSGFSDEQKKMFVECPAYVSGVDVT
jgi:hypothetical protein